MTKEQKLVIQFMDFFKQEVKTKPELPDAATRRFRASLILEEAIETINALGFSVRQSKDCPCSESGVRQPSFDLVDRYFVPDLVGIIDGAADSHYVNYCGTALACGVDMEPVFEEVHSSNMTKAWRVEDLERAKREYPTGVVEHFGEGLFRLLVNGKVIKSPNYRAANIKRILREQGWQG